MGSLLPGSERQPAKRPTETDSLPASSLGSVALGEYRDTVTAAIRAEDRDSARVVELIKAATPWSAWPERLRRALMAAITEEGDGMEAQKAHWLRGQLFREVDPGWPKVWPSTLPLADRCLVERLRMDLLGRTPLGWGRRLLADAQGRQA